MISLGVSRIAKTEIDRTELHSKRLNKSLFRTMDNCMMDIGAQEYIRNIHGGLGVAFTADSVSLDADVRRAA